jgi:NAD(P)-dependent dehydrogenase (short-subunit alcohol dehydrogenase family)
MKNVIIITGASSGFGSLASHALARAGHTVYAGIRETTDRNAPQVEEAYRFSKEYGVDLRTVEMDVSNQPSVDAAVKAIIEQQGSASCSGVKASAGPKTMCPALWISTSIRPFTISMC